MSSYVRYFSYGSRRLVVCIYRLGWFAHPSVYSVGEQRAEVSPVCGREYKP